MKSPATLSFLLFSLLPVLSHCALLDFTFSSPEAKAKFVEENRVGDLDGVCVHRADDVRDCGRVYLMNPANINREGYLQCIMAIGLPPDFVTEISSLTSNDFISRDYFIPAYNRKLQNYVKALDAKFTATVKPDDKKTWVFEMNFLAIGLLVVAALGVYLINKKGVRNGENFE